MTLDKFDFHVDKESETELVAKAIADSVTEGLVIGLTGTLGAGKTRLVQMIGRAWQIPDREIVSPTFTLCTIHQGTHEFHHVDAYRIEDDDQWMELEFDEVIDDGKIVFIEWVEKFDHFMPDDWLRIELEILGEETRMIGMTASGPKSRKVLEGVRKRLSSN